MFGRIVGVLGKGDVSIIAEHPTMIHKISLPQSVQLQAYTVRPSQRKHSSSCSVLTGYFEKLHLEGISIPSLVRPITYVLLGWCFTKLSLNFRISFLVKILKTGIEIVVSKNDGNGKVFRYLKANNSKIIEDKKTCLMIGKNIFGRIL